MNISRLILLLCASFLCAHAKAQDTLHWSSKDTLTWDDFKGKPNLSSSHLAISSTGISYSLHYADSSCIFKVAAFFNKSNSWRKPSADLKVLKHEQGHFNITEIFARKLEAALQQLKPDRDTIKKTIDQLAANIINDKNEYQKKYDLETGFGTNNLMQQKWEQVIQAQLRRSNDLMTQ